MYPGNLRANGDTTKMKTTPIFCHHMAATSLTHFPAFVSLLRASLEMTWPQMSFIGGLLSEVCCLRMGQANTEWYQHFFPRSISICSYRGGQSSQGFEEGWSQSQQNSTRQKLTGSSSLCVQTPLHCLCSITCLMFISTGNAMQPEAKLKANQTIAILHLEDQLMYLLLHQTSCVNELVVNLGSNNPWLHFI